LESGAPHRFPKFLWDLIKRKALYDLRKSDPKELLIRKPFRITIQCK